MSDGRIGIRTVFGLIVLFGGALGGCRFETEAPVWGEDAAVLPTQPDAGVITPEPNVYSAPLAAGAWAELDADGRKRFMREVVVPTMRPLFQAFDAERFAAFSCSTCHGPDAASVAFAMPSAELPALSRERVAAAAESDAAMLAFMREIVKPKMAELLGEADGLRCSSCHLSAP